jgi:hypothetical protein
MVLALFLALVLLGLAGCGDSENPISSGRSALPAAPNRSFIKAYPHSPIVRYGHEASHSELEAASLVVEENTKARVGHEYAKQCESFAKIIVRNLVNEGLRLKVHGSCPRVLESEAEKAPASVFVNSMTGPIDALRVERDGSGYALYHGKKGKDYSVRVLRESGTWKVNELLPSELEP